VASVLDVTRIRLTNTQHATSAERKRIIERSVFVVIYAIGVKKNLIVTGLTAQNAYQKQTWLQEREEGGCMNRGCVLNVRFQLMVVIIFALIAPKRVPRGRRFQEV